MQDLLKQVSRSFYLTLRILPQSLRPQLSLAYLLARATDTVVDTQLVDIPRRRATLLQIRKGILDACDGRPPSLPDFGAFAGADSSTPGERLLLENLGQLLQELQALAPNDRLLIGRVLQTITQGQEMDLMRFGAGGADRIVALRTDSELDEYTYQVAGCVGEFWTHMCRVHVFPQLPLDDEALLARGVRFGKGLQLVNVLRDLPKDLRQGRCYIPQEQLSKHGLQPPDLLDSAQIGRFRPLYDSYLQQAENHLASGWQYTLMLPVRYIRIRLACAWPILIGMRTIAQLRRDNILDDRHRIKLSRSEIRRVILRSIILYPNPKAWKGLFES